MKSQGRLMGCKAGVTMEEQQAWARASDRREALGATNRPPKSWENDDPPHPWECWNCRELVKPWQEGGLAAVIIC